MSEIKGIGIDLCAIDRIARALERENFVKRVYTSVEREYLEQCGRKRPDSAAGMFAAKEAVSKALGTGFSGGIMPEHIEVFHTPAGAPEIHLTGPADDRFRQIGGTQVNLSISHEQNMAAAFAVIS